MSHAKIIILAVEAYLAPLNRLAKGIKKLAAALFTKYSTKRRGN